MANIISDSSNQIPNAATPNPFPKGCVKPGPSITVKRNQAIGIAGSVGAGSMVLAFLQLNVNQG